jgi:hypothetical protein
MSLKTYLAQELEKRGIDRFTKNLRDMCSEIQACMIEYQEEYSTKAMNEYVYVYYDFGERLPD